MREKNIKYLMPIKINHTFKKFNLKFGFNFTFTYDDDTIRAKKLSSTTNIIFVINQP